MEMLKGTKSSNRPTINMSGFGGGYEKAMQVMLEAGLAWLEKHKTANLKFSGIRNVVGIIRADSPDAKTLSDVVGRSVKECTGAMHECVLGHLMLIHAHGYKKWFESFKQERIFLYDGTLKSCPKRNPMTK